MDITEQVGALSIANPRHRGTPVFIHGSSERQYSLAFPKFIIDYIIKKPQSPEQWKKLIQTCKLFFDKNPVAVIPYLHHSRSDGWVALPCRAKCVINLLNAPFKLWITYKLCMLNKNDNQADAVKFLIPKLYKILLNYFLLV